MGAEQTRQGFMAFTTLRVFKPAPVKLSWREKLAGAGWRLILGLHGRSRSLVRPELARGDAELLELRAGLPILAFQQGDRPGQEVLKLLPGGVQLLGGVVELGLEAFLLAVLLDELVHQLGQGGRIEPDGLDVGLVGLHSGQYCLRFSEYIRLGCWGFTHGTHRRGVWTVEVYVESVVPTTFDMNGGDWGVVGFK